MKVDLYRLRSREIICSVGSVHPSTLLAAPTMPPQGAKVVTYHSRDGAQYYDVVSLALQALLLNICMFVSNQGAFAVDKLLLDHYFFYLKII